MALTNKLTAIADAIRAKTGKSGALTLEQMATEIGTLGAVTPAYIQSEADRVAALVRGVRTGNSLTFAVFSDMHLKADDATPNSHYECTKKSADMAAKTLIAINKQTHIDANILLGDYTYAAKTYTVAMALRDFSLVKQYFADIEPAPSAWLMGNHEINYDKERDRTTTDDELYSYLGSNSIGFVRDPNYPNRNYGYLDFPNQRIRMICLNTADALAENPAVSGAKASSEGMSSTQLQWLADVALDIPSAGDWGIVICSHHPLTYNDQIKRAMQILEAYKNGTSGKIDYQLNGKSYSVSYDFASGDKAEIICNIHGHSHNFRHEKIGLTEAWLWRFCMPCINVTRENECATSTDTTFAQKWGEFNSNGDPIYYRKATWSTSINGWIWDEDNGTSYCIVTIDRDAKKIYAHYVGTGIDRIVSYAEEVATYTVTNNLTNCTISNAQATIAEGEPYSATIQPVDNSALSSVIVTMGGTTIQSGASGTISIAEVTGNIVITAVALMYPPTSNEWANRVLEATTEVNGSTIFNTVGYMDGKYISGSAYGNDSATTSTGYIEYPMTPVSAPTIYVKGITLDYSANSHCRLYFSQSNGTTQEYNMLSDPRGYMTDVCLDATTKYYKITPVVADSGNLAMYDNFGTFAAFRISGVGVGANLIVTLDEPIDTVPSYSITNNLTDCTNSNSATSIEAGSAYSAIITAGDGYNLSSVAVSMGGVDITTTAYADGVINIAGVTGNIVITAVAVKAGPSYTNQLLVSTDTSGNILNSQGYLTDTRLNSSGVETAISGFCTTGFIPCKAGDVIRLQGINHKPAGSSNNRIWFYTSAREKANTSAIQGGQPEKYTEISAITNSSGVITQFTVAPYGTVTDVSNVAFFRISGETFDADAIITVNEEIA